MGAVFPQYPNFSYFFSLIFGGFFVFRNEADKIKIEKNMFPNETIISIDLTRAERVYKVETEKGIFLVDMTGKFPRKTSIKHSNPY